MCNKKFCIGCCIYSAVLLFLIAILLFVIVPVVFMFSVGLQKNLIFPTFIIEPKSYENPEQYGITGVRNMYIDISYPDSENITLGVWQVLPSEMVSDIVKNEDYNFDGALSNEKYHILLYLHGNGSDRTNSVQLYQILRDFFHIFAVDYRVVSSCANFVNMSHSDWLLAENVVKILSPFQEATKTLSDHSTTFNFLDFSGYFSKNFKECLGYADSTAAELTEDNIANDIKFVYKWLKGRSKSKIFIWGHSLGTGVATLLTSNLKKENIFPTGVVLETPFTSVTDIVKLHPIVKFYSFLPWYEATIIEPIRSNGMDFNSKVYISDVDCPIMILHAEDDEIIPYQIATELYFTAINNRNLTYQGEVTYHLYDPDGYGHMYIYLAPKLPFHVKDFLAQCLEFSKKNL